MECPACHHRQAESDFAIGTICRVCRESYSIKESHPLWRTVGVDGKTVSLIERTVSFFTERPRQVWTQWEIRRTWHKKKRPFVVDDSSPDNTRRLTCPFCATELTIPRTTQIPQCLSCGGTFGLDDIEISDICHRRLVTRGKITVHHGGNVVAPQLISGDLMVFGAVSGSINSSGIAEFHGEGHSVGSLTAHHLLIAPDARWTFNGPIRVHSAEILGHVTGAIVCNDRLRLARTAVIVGDVQTGQLSMESGGQIQGTVSTISNPAIFS